MIRNFLDIGNKYAKESTWKDFALVKFCIFSMGLFAGMKIREKNKKPLILAATVVFVVTYVPLMVKVFGVAANFDKE